VCGRLRRDAHAGLAGVGDRRDDVVGVRREGDRRGMLVEQEVERRSSLVPAGIARNHDGAGKDFGERGVRAGGEHAPMVGRWAPAVDPAITG
jgi:hypothetical protein